MLEVEIDVLDKNNRLAARNRARFAAKQQLVLNLVSSPGSGKTTLLTETLTWLKGRADCAVIEGDQQTVNDAARIRATGTGDSGQYQERLPSRRPDDRRRRPAPAAG